MGDMRELSPCERDKANAKHRIKYKHTSHYIKNESFQSKDLTEIISKVIRKKMSQEERKLLIRDINTEMKMIENYHSNISYPSGEQS
jgi:hypothetical protein